MIKLTCDMGEGIGNDATLMPYIHSCSIACGYHAGDKRTMQETVSIAKLYNVEVGAHPSFPDRENFGRKEMHLPIKDLAGIIADQIFRLKGICESLEIAMSHIKPHGALYNMAVWDPETAIAIVDAIVAVDNRLRLYTPFHGKLAKAAKENNISVAYEAFADRNYDEKLNLIPRMHGNATLEDPLLVWEHVKTIVEEKQVKTITGKLFPIEADVICVHGDNPNALKILKYLHSQLKLY